MRALKKREKQLIIYFGLLLLFLTGDSIYRRREVTIIKETEHYIIYSSASRQQTDEIANVAEITYEGYQELLKQLDKEINSHDKLKMKLFKDRDEFRRCNRNVGWAEAFYRYPYCYQYYANDEENPYHWAIHEATHQLNMQAAYFSLMKWLDEGMACYISTSKIVDESLKLGELDLNTYPIWWFEIFATTGNLESDKENISVIPLKAIISGHGGPDLDEYFNLYYLHWWSLVHFLMNYDNAKYRDGLSKLIEQQGTLESFERNIGPVDIIEKQWYGYTKQLKDTY